MEKNNAKATKNFPSAAASFLKHNPTLTPKNLYYFGNTENTVGEENHSDYRKKL